MSGKNDASHATGAAGSHASDTDAGAAHPSRPRDEDGGAAFAGAREHQGAREEASPAEQTTEVTLREALQRVSSELQALQQQHLQLLRSVRLSDTIAETVVTDLLEAYDGISEKVEDMSAEYCPPEAERADRESETPAEQPEVPSPLPAGRHVFTSSTGLSVDLAALVNNRGAPFKETTQYQMECILRRFDAYCARNKLEMTVSNIPAFVAELRKVSESSAKTYTSNLNSTVPHLR